MAADKISDFAIEACDISITYRRPWVRRAIQALDGLSLSVRRRSCCALVGPPGAGKTTLIKILRGTLRPDSGSVRIFGKAPGGAALQAYPNGRSFLKSNAGASALLVLDEPLGGVDAAARARILDLLRERRSVGGTILLCSRQIGGLEPVCDEMAILHDGKVVGNGPFERSRPPRGFRMVVGGIPDRMQEELIASGFMVGISGAACWIESPNRERLNPLIDRVRAAGVSIQSVESTGP